MPNLTQDTCFKFATELSGCDALAAALRKLRIATAQLWDADINTKCKRLCRTNCHAYKHYADVKQRKPHEIRRLDFITCGSPCQSFSSAGKRRGLNNPRGWLWTCTIQSIAEGRPGTFPSENVIGLWEHNCGKTITGTIRCLEQAKYHIIWAILSADRMGMPLNQKPNLHHWTALQGREAKVPLAWAHKGRSAGGPH